MDFMIVIIKIRIWTSSKGAAYGKDSNS